MSRWNAHACWRDWECQLDGPCYRIHVNTPYGCLIIAVAWADRAQLWLPLLGYTKWWAPIVWHPRYKPGRRPVRRDRWWRL